jgi:hypothetical protein
MKRMLRDIFPLKEEDLGTAAIGGGGQLSTQAIQSPDSIISFQRRNSAPKKKKPINKIK